MSSRVVVVVVVINEIEGQGKGEEHNFLPLPTLIECVTQKVQKEIA